MRIKKGIVLFVTILFILAISVLIVKNLEITDQFISLSSKNSNIKQLELTIKDVNSAILDLFKNKRRSIIDEFPPVIPFSYGNVEVEVTLEPYDLKSYRLDDNLTKNADQYLANTIDLNTFSEIIKGKKITNQKQVDAVIDEYITKTNDRDILDIEGQLVYFDTNSSAEYISCKYDIDIDGLKASVDMIFEPNKNNTKPIKLDINIKR